MKEACLAVDFGGGSGRVMAGFLTGEGVKLEEICRFPNRQVRLGDRLYWDFPALFRLMLDGIAQAVRKGYRIRSIGIDTWGVDFGLIDKSGGLLGNPVCYRDPRTAGLPELFFKENDPALHYAETGIRTMEINTLFQLISMRRSDDVRLEAADALLFMPDLFSYYLTGTANSEYTIASTSELLDAAARDWSGPLISRAGLPARLFRPIVHPGTVRGVVKPEIAAETGLPADVRVIAVGSHDTASAAFAAPKAGAGGAFLSSGTWSLLGAVLDEPILTEQARKAGFSNEGGVRGKICFLQNITGLWIVQRLMAEWESRGESVTYDMVNAEAARSESRSVIDVDDACFLNPDSMERCIRSYCRRSGQPEPVSKGDFMRCICESLACRYRKGVMELNRLLPAPVSCLNVIGGGCRNELLNRLTADALGIPVYAGPVEATALGSIMVQVCALGDADWTEAGKIMARSTELRSYTPEKPTAHEKSETIHFT